MSAPSSQPSLTALVVMGVSGSGKTTFAEALAEHTGWPFQEGDDLHPAQNVAKMKSGHPLTDADRAPWLAAIADHIDAWRGAGLTGIVTCSALKRAYREQLASSHADVRFVYMHGERALLADRLRARQGHFMPASLLVSQLATLEPPDAAEDAITVDIAQSMPDQLAVVTQALGLDAASAEPGAC